MKTIAILLAALAISLTLPACDSKSGSGDGHTDHSHSDGHTDHTH